VKDIQRVLRVRRGPGGATGARSTGFYRFDGFLVRMARGAQVGCVGKLGDEPVEP